ncbi:hypothetical protein [Ideonella sp. A 288]|uniref:hypothetical protein n=1 Tax=Ideonella sp. A 288 TaxID=1962181 RepID=UPI000B4A66E7|nr:hypothetical protein [Ideonella sp. A 288]
MATTRKSAAKTPAGASAKTGRRAAAEAPARDTTPRGAKPATAARPSAGIAPETLDTLAQLQQVKTDLEAVSAKLNGFDPDAMSDAEREAWSNQMDRIDLAIARARNALLSGLVQAFDAEVAGLQAATGQLAAELQRLNKIALVIETVAAVLGVVERVITLGR